LILVFKRYKKYKKNKKGKSENLVSKEPKLPVDKSQKEKSLISLMFVGHSTAGKTSLKKCFQDRPTLKTYSNLPNLFKNPSSSNHNSPRLNHSSTHGIDFCEIEEFIIWDFAGQKEYHSAHSLFFISSAIYLIVFNPESKNWTKDIEDWM
jgi:GTPase SAR1 family protein